jgi:PKD repeat protein
MKSLHLLLFAVLALLLQGCYEEPVANFDYSYVDNLAPADVSFTNLSSEADKFQWDFGDGEGSSEKNPSHSFYNMDHPIVTLLAKGRGGENMVSKSIAITSYFVKNSSSSTYYDIITYYWDGENVVDDFNLGNLYPGYDSDVVATTHSVIDVALELSDGTFYLVKYSYTLNEDEMSYLNITDETEFVEVNSKKKGSLTQSDFHLIQENGQGILLKDLMAQ